MITMLSAGVKEFNLTKYLVSQLMLSNEERINDLRVFLPEAKDEDWGSNYCRSTCSSN